MKIVTAAAMREADRRTSEELGLPGAVLMETAAMRAVELVLALSFSPARVVVAAGPGNNGGDGLAVARLLKRAGLEVSLWSTVPAGGYRGDAAINERFLRECAFPVNSITGPGKLPRFKEALAGAGLVVDALLGTGVNRPVEGLPAELIALINGSGRPVLALDIPSGVNADTGEIMGCAVQARWTVTFAFPKRGLLLYPGAARAGAVITGEINVPAFLVESEPAELATARSIAALLPGRPPDAHKGSAGRALLVAGSPGMSGAAALAAGAALRGGAGLVYLAAPQSLCPALEARLTEVITVALPEAAPGVIDPGAAAGILERAAGCQAVAAGPGLDPSEATAALLEELVRRCPAPLVLDAGALGALAGNPALLQQARQPCVVTPHAGEMARLLGITPEEVQRSRPELAARCAREWRCILVLKGANTVVADPGGMIHFNPTGGPALATAGTGDLLTGLITALLARGLAPVEAARAGAFIHGLAGDLLPDGGGHTAGDVLAAFPEAFRVLAEKSRSPSPWGPFLHPVRPLP